MKVMQRKVSMLFAFVSDLRGWVATEGGTLEVTCVSEPGPAPQHGEWVIDFERVNGERYQLLTKSASPKRRVFPRSDAFLTWCRALGFEAVQMPVVKGVTYATAIGATGAIAEVMSGEGDEA
ncbi:hypothetical protein GALL_450240 [mine drainage metagenome]|uniref:Uncharacterized protein n=1 Tax=mine drainage metagenome TaxID=410659 RepID=A0A1J5PZZ5_9ZZZZ